MAKPVPITITAPVLVLCYPEQRLTAALVEDGRVHAAQQWTVPGQAMQFMAPALQDILSRLDITPADLAGIACVRGPGSFTGLRMVMATALGIARAADVPLAGLDYLPLLAAGPGALLGEGTLGVVTYSRARQVYVQPFSTPDGAPLCAPRPLSLDAAAQALGEHPGPLRLLGTGVRKNAEFFAQALPTAHVLDARHDNPLPEVLAQAVLAAEFGQTPPEPLYLRASDAEDNLTSIAAARGLDARTAHKRLDEATTGIISPDC